MYQVARDGEVTETFETEPAAKKALRSLKLKPHENGYLDECDGEGNHVQSLYQKMTTSGKLLECW